MKKTIILAGAPPGTGNMGVSALKESILLSIASKLEGELLLFDFGKGLRPQKNIIKSKMQLTFCGAKNSRKFYANESFMNIKLMTKFNGLINSVAKKILTADVMLDISGGDSFTDMYGYRRFQTIIYPKEIALENNIPLILLPQTYGPFNHGRVKQKATDIIKRSSFAWARDNDSYNDMKELLKDDFDENRHFSGVDVAFLLDYYRPKKHLPINIERWISNKEIEVVGVNVSGLIYNNAEHAKKQYGLSADYRFAMLSFIKKMLKETGVKIVLVPHVLVEENHFESDVAACKHLLNFIPKKNRGRVEILPASYNQCELKWIISKFDWFCGTRMHSTIAALSTGVTTAAVAYSLKTRRVFETCGMDNEVVDPRELDTDDVVDGLWECWQRRNDVASRLSNKLPNVLEVAKSQAAQICQQITSL